MPAPLDDGRTGRVPAGCVFWIKATDQTFSTVAEDHGNCSVGSLTHGFKTLDEVAGELRRRGAARDRLGDAWTSCPQIPVVAEKPGSVTYGPLCRHPGRSRRRAAPDQRQADDDALGRHPRVADRGQAAVPHRRGREGTGRDRRQRRVRAEPSAHRDVGQRDDVRDPGVEARRGAWSRSSATRRPTRPCARYAADDARRFGEPG